MKSISLAAGSCIGLALLASVVLTACNSSQANTPVGPPPMPEVTVVTVQPQSVPMATQLAGRTTPTLIAEVRPQVGGIVVKRLFTEGADVKAGQALYRIDAASLSASVSNAEGALAKAEANLTSARVKADRSQDLARIDAVSKQSDDDAKATLQQAEADVTSQKAALQTARINLAWASVTAPIAGRIGRSAVTQGALVTAGQATALATVQQLDPIYVDVTQSSSELMRLKRELSSGHLKSAGADQAKVQLLLEDGSRYPLEGRLQFSDVTVDPGTGNVTLRAVFPNPKQDLLPGMYVRAVLEEGVDDAALLVPQQGVTHNAKGDATALVVGQDGKVEQRTLQTRRAIGDQWLVGTGLAAGDRVIVQGLQKVRPGAAVKATEQTAPQTAQAAANLPGAAGPATTAQQ